MSKKKSDWQQLKEHIEKGVLGKVEGAPISLNKLGKYVSIRQKIYTLIGGFSGTGKTALVDAIWVLEPYMWYLDNKNKTDIKMEWIYRSMERSKKEKLGKWACYKIWRDHGELILPSILMGYDRKIKLNERQMAMFHQTEEFFETMQDSHIVTVIEGQENPRGIFLQFKEHMESRGVHEKLSEYEEVFHLNDPNLITQHVIDHAGKCKLESVGGVKDRKTTTDKLSEYMSIERDMYHASPVVISQFNQSVQSQIFNKQADPEPTVESFKNTGNLIEDCDLAISLFNPFKYKLYDHMGYKIPEFIDISGGPYHGANYFRSLKILKSSYSQDDVRFGLGFMGQIGKWKDLPRMDEMDESITAGIKDLMYFAN